MATPLFDKHGITINDPSDGWHTESEIQDFADSIASVPLAERPEFYQALRTHWDHFYLGDLILDYGRNGGSSLSFRKELT